MILHHMVKNASSSFFGNFSLSFISSFAIHGIHFCFLRYYRFNENSRSVDSDYPKPISVWQGVPDNIKGAFMSEDGGTAAFVLLFSSCGFFTVLFTKKKNHWSKRNFQQSLLQSSVSHDSTEIILICCFGAQETFLIIINVENSCAA